MKIWNPKWFLPISFFFSFFPVAIIFALNLSRLGFTRKRNIYILVACSIFIVAAFLGNFIPENIANPFFAVLNIGLAIYMKQVQTTLYQHHIENGGESASYLIPLFTCVVIALMLFGLII